MRGPSKKLSWQSPSPKSNAAYQRSHKEIFTNKKETQKAIKAAVDQKKKFQMNTGLKEEILQKELIYTGKSKRKSEGYGD